MGTKNKLCYATILLLPFFISCCSQKSLELPALYKKGKLEVINREIQVVPGDSAAYIQISENTSEGIVWLPLKEFKKGTIEIEMRGKDVFQRSFIGVVFHGVNDSTYDAVYCRPFNFFSTDSVRKIHAIQYISHPDFTWKKLRDEKNAKFEKQIMDPPDPAGWFTMKLIIDEAIVKAFINDAEVPDLIVQKLNERQTGKIGLFTGDGSGGDFKKIRIHYK